MQSEADIAWKQSGQATIQQQRGKWVARVEGIDTETGSRHPREFGTLSSKRAGADRPPDP